MIGALEWIGNIGTAFVEIFPRRTIVDTTQRGVRWRYGKNPELLEPGVYWWWPLFTILNTIEVKYSTLDICKQSVEDSNKNTVGVSGWITYEVSNPLSALTDFTDFEDTLQETAAGIISQIINEQTSMLKIKVLSQMLKEQMAKTNIGQVINIEEFSVSDYFIAKHTLLQWQP